jgi:hypothetical protein
MKYLICEIRFPVFFVYHYVENQIPCAMIVIDIITDLLLKLVRNL